MKKTTKIIITILIFFVIILLAIVIISVLENNRNSGDSYIRDKNSDLEQVETEIQSTRLETKNAYLEDVAVIESDIDYNTKSKETDSIETDKADKADRSDIELFRFVDVFGKEYQTEIIPDVPKSPYDKAKFKHNAQRLVYEDSNYYSRLGIDVSHHQGKINWEKVKAAGYDFAFIRIGFRGYGQSGSINVDRTFESNIKNAHAAGIDVGVYFFSQAINEEEAQEEAEFVIRQLNGCNIELPVVYDPENILDAQARTDDVSGIQFTKNTLLFCRLISEAGYEPMIYSNMLWEAFQFDMTQVCGYQFWYADYELLPQTPYNFTFWQYSNKGDVDGVSGLVDLDIELLKRE